MKELENQIFVVKFLSVDATTQQCSPTYSWCQILLYVVVKSVVSTLLDSETCGKRKQNERKKIIPRI